MKRRKCTKFQSGKREAESSRARFAVPISRVQGISEEQMFKVVKTGTSLHGMVLTKNY